MLKVAEQNLQFVKYYANSTDIAPSLVCRFT